MDLHAHLSSQPVHGLLGGTWDERDGGILSVKAAEMVREAPLPLLTPASADAAASTSFGVADGVGGDEGIGSVGSIVGGEGIGGSGGDHPGEDLAAACGMDAADAERALAILAAHGLICVGRWAARTAYGS